MITQRSESSADKSLDRFAELLPHGARQRVQLVGPIEHDGRDRAVALDEDRIGHRLR